MSAIKDCELEEIADRLTRGYIQNFTMFEVNSPRYRALYITFINFYHEIKLIELKEEFNECKNEDETYEVIIEDN